jgi:hypothetical protein
VTASYWGVLARAHWQRHLPRRLAALEDPDRFFADLEDEAQAYYAAIRDGLVAGLNPNNGTIGWVEFVTRVDQANAVAREIVGTELIFLPGEDDQGDDDDDGEGDGT